MIQSTHHHWKAWLKVLVILVAGCWIYTPTLHGGWLRDDDIYVTENPLLQDPDRLWKAWFKPGSFVEYYPIEQSVQWIQWQLWHNDTFGYHVTNVVLHLLSALLVWWLFRKLKLRLAWLGGLIFVVHPAMVESVVWITELKNTLSLPPFLLAMGAWIDYEERGRRSDYLLALGFFLVAMLCKVSMSPFPFVILLYAWWKRGRIGWHDFRAAVPFFGISLVLGLATVMSGIWFLQNQMLPPESVLAGGLMSRIACAGTVLAFYLRLSVWPFDLMPYYPKWSVDPPSWPQFLPWLVLAGLSGWFWKERRTWGRHVLLGFGFFVITLFPFLGLNVSTYMRFSWVMDHFLYIPILGLIGCAVAGWGCLMQRFMPRVRLYAQVILALILGFFAGQSRGYAQVFINEESLWAYMLDHAPDSWLAHNNVGNIQLRKGDLTGALEHFQRAAQLNPESFEALTNEGVVFAMRQEWPKAITCFQQVLKINPDYLQARNDLGTALFSMGQDAQATTVDEEELRRKPNDPLAHNNLGLVLIKLGRIPDAIDQFQAAVSDAPTYAEAHNNWGRCLVLMGDNFGAIEHYREALQLKPVYAEAHFNLGNALAQTGQPVEAISEYREALAITPEYAEAHQNLGCILAQVGRTSEAIAQLQEAIRLKPDYAMARANLARLLAPAVKAAGKK